MMKNGLHTIEDYFSLRDQCKAEFQISRKLLLSLSPAFSKCSQFYPLPASTKEKSTHSVLTSSHPEMTNVVCINTPLLKSSHLDVRTISQALLITSCNKGETKKYCDFLGISLYPGTSRENFHIQPTL